MDNKTLQWKIPILNNRNVYIENISSQNGNCILINVWAFIMVTTTNITFLDNGMPNVKIEIEIGTLECRHVSFIWSDIFNLLVALTLLSINPLHWNSIYWWVSFGPNTIIHVLIWKHLYGFMPLQYRFFFSCILLITLFET